MKSLLLFAGACLLAGCATSCPITGKSTAAAEAEVKTKAKTKATAKLQGVVASMSDEHKARHVFRNPEQTLSFFDVQPGETVVEALPGGGWYSQILAPYLGTTGRLIGVDYAMTMWPNFPWAGPEFVAGRKAWLTEFPQNAKTWGAGEGFEPAPAEAYTFATLPAELTGQVDKVLFIRALHNLARFDDNGGFLSQALRETHRILKPNGYVGIVQHALAEDKPDAWGRGQKGYLKRSFVVDVMARHGFELVAESAINQNPKDDVQADEAVWRLPPSLRVNDSEKAKYAAIGESNRMTLLFKKVTLPSKPGPRASRY